MKRCLSLLHLMLLLLAAPAWATCYKVIAVGTATTTALDQIRPGEGTAAFWDGACDTCSGSLGLPSVVNVSDPGFQPYPALLASAVVPATRYASPAGYDAERVLFRCAAADAVYEMYSTNGDNLFSGWYNGGDSVGNSVGLQAAYRTAWPNVLLRLTHVESGRYFTDVWGERLLTGLDTDSRGFKLVKAKNLSAVRAELFSAPSESTYYYAPVASQLYGYTQPAAYIAIKGPGLSYPTVGQTHYGNYSGWYAFWPAAISLYGNVTLKRQPTCAILTVTPQVVFPSMSIAELNAGASREASFQVGFKCQTGTTSSTAVNGTSLGVKVSAGARAAASSLGLVNANGGVSHLLSDRYGEAGMAKGVGIRILRGGNAINLLGDENSSAGVNAQAHGWYPAVGASSNAVSTNAGVTQYSETFGARIEKIEAGTRPEVSAGRVEATAQIIIRVQ
ncbi:MAG: fimbrial protein [Stenotrophomonas sp.]|uniref:fimbrial protein n=1 Tax=Stenotrophomonas sp. TaxID=69392 RepID=UPI003D6C8D9B